MSSIPSTLSSSSSDFLPISQQSRSETKRSASSNQESHDQFTRQRTIEPTADELGCNPVLGALIDNDLGKLWLAINQGANVTMEGDYCPLHQAARFNDADFVKMLLNKGAQEDINKKDDGEKTPLEHAFKLNTPDVAKLLLLHGANPAGLPEAVQQKNVPFFEEALASAVEALDCLAVAEAMKKELGVQTLSKENSDALKVSSRQNLDMAKNIINADIPGIDLTPFIKHCDRLLAKTNYEIAEKLALKNEAQAKYGLHRPRLIFRLGLPLDQVLLDEYKSAAFKLKAQSAFDDAVRASIVSPPVAQAKRFPYIHT
jgi:hypothetical protein